MPKVKLIWLPPLSFEVVIGILVKAPPKHQKKQSSAKKK